MVHTNITYYNMRLEKKTTLSKGNNDFFVASDLQTTVVVLLMLVYSLYFTDPLMHCMLDLNR